MDESHLIAAIRYVEMKPVAAGLVSSPAEYRWSSARGHSENTHDMLATVFPFPYLILNWVDYLRLSSEKELKMMKDHEKTGRPLGSNSFIDKIEHAVGRILRPQKPGPKKKRHNS